MSRHIRLRLAWERKLPEAISELHAVYRRAYTATTSFASKRGVSCPTGCGRCCESFVPDASDAEAEYAARFLILGGHSPDARNTITGACPFYHSSSPHHCVIYAARPLVCRLFGFSGTRDKNGRPVFRPCRHAEQSLLRSGSGEPPAMRDFVVPFGETGSFPDMLRRHIGRLLLKRELVLSCRRPIVSESARPSDDRSPDDFDIGPPVGDDTSSVPA